MPTTEAEPAGERSGWRRLQVADVVFGVLASGTVVCWYVWGRSLILLTDDWLMIDRGRSIPDFFRPFNDHLSVVPIAVWRTSYHLFGLRTYVPLLLVGIASLSLVAVGLFLEVRARVGSPVALYVGAVMLWFPSLTLAPQAFNHYLAIAAGILCASTLRRSGSSDYLLAAALTFSLCSSGAGVAVAAGCLTYVLLSRAPLRRWVAVLVPTGAWAVWWVLVSHQTGPAFARTFGQNATFVRDGILDSFSAFTLGNRVAGAVLLVAFVAAVAWRCRHGLRGGCSGLAWCIGLLAWWLGLAASRGLLAAPDRFYYDLVGAVFIVLAAVPEQLAPSRRRLVEGWRAVAVAVVAVVVVMASAGGAIRDRSRAATLVADRARGNITVVRLGRAVVPDDSVIPFAGVTLTARRLRQLFRAYGAPSGTHPTDVDGALIRWSMVGVSPANEPRGECRLLDGTARLHPNGGILLHAPDGAVTVSLRRFGTVPRPVATIPAHGTIAVIVPGIYAANPWLLDAPGACTPTR